MLDSLFDKIGGWLNPKIKDVPLNFPSKEGQNYTSCISLLDLHGSLFCLDNKKILFKDSEGDCKVIEPVKILPPSENRNNLDAYVTEDGFAIKYDDKDYFYKAKMKVFKDKFLRIKLEDIRQPVYGITVDKNCICVEKEADK